MLFFLEIIVFYASAQHSVAGGILFLSCSSVHVSVYALWDRVERVTIWGQKVKVTME